MHAAVSCCLVPARRTQSAGCALAGCPRAPPSRPRAPAAQVKQAEARAFVRSVRAAGEREGAGLDMAVAPALLAGRGGRLSPAWFAACLATLPAPAARSAFLGSSNEALRAAAGAGLLAVAVPAALSKRGRFDAHMVCDGFGAGGGASFPRIRAALLARAA